MRFIVAIAIAAAGVFALPHAIAQPPPKFNHPLGDFVTVNSIKLWYETEGKGEPLLLIAGGPGLSHSYFHPFFSALADSYQLIYLDAYGSGRSDRAKPSVPYSMESDVENIEALRIALKLGKINVLGHSYGGFVAQLYAFKYPNSVRRLILANTLPSGRDYQKALNDHNRDVQNEYPEIWANVARLRAAGKKANSKEVQDAFAVPGTLHNFYNPDNAGQLPRTEPDLYNPEPWYAIAGDDADFVVKGELSRFNVRPRLKHLAMPVLVLAGRFDRNVPPRLTQSYKRLIPTGQFEMFEKSGHFTFVEEAEKTFSVIRRFLAK